jgi:cytochrome c oxidase assembly factor CtaG
VIRRLAPAAGLIAAIVAVAPPVHGLASRSLAWHMLQVTELMCVAAPLLALGGAAAVLPGRMASGLSRLEPAIRRPELPAAAFAATAALVHLPGPVGWTRSSAWLAVAEHAVVLSVGVAFWAAVLGAARPSASPGRRIACMLLAMPAGDAVGVWIMATGGAAYAGVSRPEAMAAGAAMLAGSLPLGLGAAALAWGACVTEERERRAGEVAHVAP